MFLDLIDIGTTVCRLMQVVEWVLGGVRTEWHSSSFQAAVGSPAAFMNHYISLHSDAAGHPEVIAHDTACLATSLMFAA